MKFLIGSTFFYPDVRRHYRELVEDNLAIVKLADELGYYGVTLAEHHFNNYICNPSHLQYVAYFAAHTQRLRLMTTVLVLPYHKPLALAEEIALADHLSEGRLDVGVARGANKYEFDRLGIDWNQNRAMYDEALDIIQKAWTTEDFEYHGKFWSFPRATTLPRPYQQPHPPLWISGQSLEGVRAIAVKGANLLTSPNYGTFAPYGDLEVTLGEFNRALEESGRPRPNIGLLRRVHVRHTEEEALPFVQNCLEHWRYYMAFFEARQQQDRFGERRYVEANVVGGAIARPELDLDLTDVYSTYDDPIITSAEKAVARIKKYEQLGVTHMLLLMSFGVSRRDVMESMRVFATEVMPHFAEPAQERPPALATATG